jgi:hypothetical protein
MEMRWRATRIAPEVRFTHWGASGGLPQNEATVLLGFLFGGAERY